MRSLQGKLPIDHTLIFEEDGDVLIEIENYKLLVSREKLCSVSVVFAAMLNGGFREGLKITLGDRQIHQILLPEDDIDLVLLLCKLLYKRLDLVEWAPNGTVLLDLTVLCEKYQCVTSLKAELENLASRSLNVYLKTDRVNLSALLLVSYIIDSTPLFGAISEYIFDLYRERALDETKRRAFYQLLQHFLIKLDFTAKFESKYKDLNQSVDRLLSDQFWGLRICSCGGHPNLKAKRAGSLMQQLFKARLMPTDIQNASITEIDRRIENLEDVYCNHFRYCRAPSRSLKNMLKEDMEKIKATGLGLCLNCVNSIKPSGQCQEHDISSEAPQT